MFCSRCGTWTPDHTALCPLCGLALQGDHGPQTSKPSYAHLPAELPAPVVTLVTYGGFWRRFAALVLDAAVLFFPAAIVRVLLGLSALGSFEPDSPASWLAITAEFALDGLYATLFLCSSARGTLGMQVMDLHATNLKGDRISFGRSLGRYFAQLLSLVTCGIGYLLQLFTPRRQTLHDLISGVVIVRPRPAADAVNAPVMRLAL